MVEHTQTQGAGTTVEMWFDPTCPWAYLTSRWLMEVERVREIAVTWSVMSLAVLNQGRELDPTYASRIAKSWGPVRVLIGAAEEHGPQVIKPLYDAIGSRIHVAGMREYEEVIPQALLEVGLPERLGRLAGSQALDGAVRASHERAITLVGADVGTPVIAVDGVGFFGPVVSPAPRGEAAGRLWDGFRLMVGTPGFFELKRTRTVAPSFD